MKGKTILADTPHGYITIEKTGKSESYIVWRHQGTAAVRAATFGLGLTDAWARAKAKLESI